MAASDSDAAPPSEPSAADITAAIAALPPSYAGADYAHGKQVFVQCRTCHVIEKGGGDGIGPNLHSMFGRKAGAKADFPYSQALKTWDITWDADTLDAWLANPREARKGNRMSFSGMRDPNDRRDLIAYLKVQSTR